MEEDSVEGVCRVNSQSCGPLWSRLYGKTASTELPKMFGLFSDYLTAYSVICKAFLTKESTMAATTLALYTYCSSLLTITLSVSLPNNYPNFSIINCDAATFFFHIYFLLILTYFLVILFCCCYVTVEEPSRRIFLLFT